MADRQIVLQENQFLIIPPSTPHIAVNNEETNYEYLSLSLHLSRCEGAKGFFDYFNRAVYIGDYVYALSGSDFAAAAIDGITETDRAVFH